MQIPEVKQCCCGCTLRTGALIIGWLGVIGGVLQFIGGIVGLTGGEKASSSGILIAGIIGFCMGLVLLIGTNRNLASYVNLWVIISTIELCLYILGFVIAGIMAMVNVSFGSGIGIVIGGLIAAAIMAYLIIVVRSFRNELSSDGQPA